MSKTPRKALRLAGKKGMSKLSETVLIAKEEDDEANKVVEEVKIDPFEKLDEVWDLDAEGQRALISTLFSLPDGPSHSMQSMVLDECVANLCFAKECGMNNEQIRSFFDVVTEIQRLCKEGVDLKENFAYFKKTTIANSTLRKTMADVLAERKAAEEAAKPPTVEPVEPTSGKGGKSGKPDPKNKKGTTNPLPEDTSEVKPGPTTPPLNPLFTPAMVKKMTDHLVNGIYGHYNLHHCLLNFTDFTPAIKSVHNRIHIQTIVPDKLELCTAIDLDELKAREEAEAAEKERARALAEARENDTSMAYLIEKHLQAARDAMTVTLATQEKQLQSKLDSMTKASGKR